MNSLHNDVTSRFANQLPPSIDQLADKLERKSRLVARFAFLRRIVRAAFDRPTLRDDINPLGTDDRGEALRAPTPLSVEMTSTAMAPIRNGIEQRARTPVLRARFITQTVAVVVAWDIVCDDVRAASPPSLQISRRL